MHQLIQLLDALVERLFVTVQGYGNARTPIHVGWSYVKGIYIETPTTEKSGYTGQHAEFVFDKD